MVGDLGGEVLSLRLHVRLVPPREHAGQEGLHVVTPVPVAGRGNEQVWTTGERPGDAPATGDTNEERQDAVPPGERPVDVEGGDVARDHGRGIVPADLRSGTATALAPTSARTVASDRGRAPASPTRALWPALFVPAALWMPTTALSCSSAMVRAPAYVQALRIPATIWSRMSSTPGRSGSMYIRDVLIPSWNSSLRAWSNSLSWRVRFFTARCEAMPKLCRGGRRCRAGRPPHSYVPASQEPNITLDAGRQRERDISRVPDATVGPHVPTQAVGLRSALNTAENCGRPTPVIIRGAHGPRPHAHLDDVGAGLDEMARLLRSRRCRPRCAPAGPLRA